MPCQLAVQQPTGVVDSILIIAGGAPAGEVDERMERGA
jgi:hypothetical protein